MATSAAMLPVLVVGAGPSGLMVAHELKRLGIPCTLIDKAQTKSPYSRAIVVQIRTLEIFHALNLLSHLKNKGQDVFSVSVFVENKNAVSIPITMPTSLFEQPLVVDQPHTEMVLEDALFRMGQDVQRGVELVDFTVDTHGIRANMRMPHGEVKAERFSFIVGADGAHSIVRKKMANQFLGSTYDDAFILADAECVHPFDHHTFRLFFKKQHFLALIPMQGPHHYRLISVRKGETKKIGPPPTIEEFQDLVKAAVPFPLQIKNPEWVSRFFVQCRSATNYQEGRIFLVGDAAHIHSPAGGQGMNTGLQDAFNLSWKLALTLKGMATPELLSSYHDERKPVGDYLIERTDRLFKFMVKSSMWARLMRRFVLPYIGRSEKLRTRLFTIGSQTAIRYDHGAVCAHKKHIRFHNIRVGKRVPNVKLITNQLKKTDLHAVTLSCGFSCWWFMPDGVEKKDAKLVTQTAANLASQFHKGISSYLVFANDYDADKAKGDADYFVAIQPSHSFVVSKPMFVLCRPDHHVFCFGSLEDVSHGVEALARYLEKSRL